MKILHLIDHVGYGGAQTILKAFFESQQNNNELFYYALRNNKQAQVCINHANTSFGASYSIFSFQPLRDIKNLVVHNHIQVLHCHLFRSQLFGWIVKRFLYPGLIVVFHEHGEIFRNKWWFSLFLKIACRDINGFIAVSQATKTKLIKYANIDPKKIFVVYNFANENKLSIAAKNQIDREKEKRGLNISSQSYVISFFGRLDEIKSLSTLIRALPLLRFPFTVLLVGQGPEKTKLMHLAEKLGVRNLIRFVDFQDNILPFYAISDVLVLPSRSEASPMLFYESQYLGLPIIASDVPALNELIRDEKNGFLFPYQDYSALAGKISRLRNDSSLSHSVSEEAINTGRQFTLSTFTHTLTSLYAQL